MRKRLKFKDYEKRIDEDGVRWEKDQQPLKAVEVYNSYLEEIERTVTETDGETGEKEAVISYLLMRKAGVLMETARTEEAETLMRNAVKHAERSRNQTMIGRSTLGLGVYYGSAGDIKRAEDLLTLAFATFRKRTDRDSRQGAAWSLLNLGGLALKKSDLEEAEEKLKNAIRLLKHIQNWVGVGTAYEMLAKTCKAKNDPASARDNLLKAVSFFEKEGMTSKAETLRKDLQVPV